MPLSIKLRIAPVIRPILECPLSIDQIFGRQVASKLIVDADPLEITVIDVAVDEYDRDIDFERSANSKSL